jgi:hypothetical protein
LVQKPRHCLVHPPDRRVPPRDRTRKDGHDQHEHDGRQITGGVDTHVLTHHAAVIDRIGRHLAEGADPVE